MEYYHKTAFIISDGILNAEGGIGRYVRVLDNRLPKEINRITLPSSIISNIIDSQIATQYTILNSAYSLVHLPSPMPFFPLFTKEHRYTIITTAHDFMPTHLIASDIKNPFRRYWLRALANMRLSLNSNYLIVISSQTKEDAIKLGFEDKNIKVINYGLDERFFTPIRRKPSKFFRIGYVGSFPPRKNVGFAVGAVKLMDDDDITFKLYARKDMQYETLWAQSAGDKRIEFKGKQEEKDLPSIYDSFDVSVFPSLNEGFGLPILEAQARGLPVIIYKAARIPEEVRRMCFMADDEAHMAQILVELKDNGYNEKKRKESTRYARSFTWSKNIKSTIEFYKKAIR
jgi:glycosyltransferase involved in cell wall biosynthesis